MGNRRGPIVGRHGERNGCSQHVTYGRMKNALALESKIESTPELDRISLIGSLSDNVLVGLENLLKLSAKECVMNLAEISHCNSLGIRSWVNFLRVFTKDRKVSFEEVSPELTRQLTSVTGILDPGKIISFILECVNCDHVQTITVETTNPLDIAFQSPHASLCTQCGGNVELDDDDADILNVLSTKGLFKAS